jgi:hypothetical protein
MARINIELDDAMPDLPGLPSTTTWSCFTTIQILT